jgi:pSer/pThr/pTyr-binding forkhead associated (FHA) protein
MAHLKSLDDKILIPLVEGVPLQLGRSPRCEVVIDDLSISSVHARLSLREGKLKLTDLESTNGTRVNYAGIREPRYLMDGDVVEFGSFTFVVHGSELRVPDNEEENSQSLRDIPLQTTLEPVDETLRDIPVPLDEIDEGDESGQAWIPAPEAHPSRGNAAGFAVALGLLVLGGILLLAYLWTRVPPL